jgi:spore maturation protein CgeB
VATDPHVLNYDKQRTFADTFYCMQDCYKKPGDVYLPYAYDPIWHAPEDQEHLFDVCLLGLHYQNRNLLVDRLMKSGLKVYYQLGDCFDEARTIYNQAPIGINWSSKDDLTARVFELLGMRRLAVVNNVPDLPKFFRDGVDLVTFTGLEEAVEKILHYLANEEQLKTIAEQGHKTVKPHTWDARIEQILEEDGR